MIKIFVDTNVLLRATITQFPFHTEIKNVVDAYIKAETELWISRQVIREYVSQATRPQLFMQPMTASQIELQYQTMRLLFNIADETEAVTQQFVTLLQSYPTGGKQVHDANIVATMLTYGIDTLLTLNIDAFKRFSDKIMLVNPLKP